MSFSEKLYRFLLRAYPRDYRRRYAEPMEQLFRDLLCQVRSSSDFIALWSHLLVDWVISVPARYWERVRVHIHHSALTDPALRCVLFARFEASSWSRCEISVEHLLLGVLREQPSLVAPGALDTVVRTIRSGEPAGRRIPPQEDLRLAEEAIRVIAAARKMAHEAGRRQVSPEDLAGGILRQEDTLAARLLREHISNRI